MVLRIFKMNAASGFLTALECTIISFSAAVPLRTPLGELTALPRPSSWFKGPYDTSKAGEQGRERGKGEKKGRGRERDGPPHPPFANSWIGP